MTTTSLLTPPMDESGPLQDDRKPEYQRKFRVLPYVSEYEMQRLASLSMLDFDEFHNPNPMDFDYNVRAFFVKSKQYLEQYITDMKRLYREHKFETMRRRIIYAKNKVCIVVLLAMDWTGALELFQEQLRENPIEFSKSEDMYYGLGLIYLHFKHYRPAIEAFTRSIYCHPNGKIAGEARARLGVCYMELSDYERAIRMLNMTLANPEETRFLPKLILQYNIALCNENYNELNVADIAYQRLLVDMSTYEKLQGKATEEQKDQIRFLTAACHRQIGWINYRKSYKDEKNRKDLLKKAEDMLTKANELDSEDGTTYYYLGRVYGEQINVISGQVAHEAFVNYRHSIDKREQNGDCWCSIGTLYQKQNQPMDALQAFICAIELNPKLTSAWVDLGELYEKNCQYKDALECFKNAMKHNPVAPIPIKARITFLEKELNLNIPIRPPNHVTKDTFNIAIPPLREAYDQPIPLELRTRQLLHYREGLTYYSNAFWHVWEDFRPKEEEFHPEQGWGIPDPKPMQDLEVHVFELLKANESALVPAERVVYECLKTSQLVFENKMLEFMIPEVGMEMPRVTEQMILRLQAEGHLLENPRCYDLPFLPKCSYLPLPTAFSLLSKLFIPIDSTAEELQGYLLARATQQTFTPVFEEIAYVPEAPKVPAKPLATEAEIKKALEENKRHPLLRSTPLLTVENRKEAQCLELQRYLDHHSTISCIRGITNCLRLDLSLFSTKAVVETDPKQEIRVLTQYHIPPETNCDHASQPTWECFVKKSSAPVYKYAQYQADSFKATLKKEAEKMKRSGGRGPSPKRMKLMASAQQKAAIVPPKDLKQIKFGTRVKLADDAKWGKQINELSKLPAFCRLIAGSNMLSHLGHQVLNMSTVQLHMNVPGARITAHQENNNVAAVNINVGPGDCEWFAVPYEYAGKIEKMCDEKEIDFFKDSFWPILDDLLEAGIPVHRCTQKAGDMVYVSGGTLHWVQATGWCNTISWNVAPMTNHQLLISLRSYEYNRLRSFRSKLPMQMLCWQLAKNVKFTNQTIYNTCRGILIRSLSYFQMVVDWLNSIKKTIKIHNRTSGEPSHFCKACLSEVFNMLFVKEEDSVFHVYCAYCARSQNLEEFTPLQQIPFADMVKIYDNMKYFSPASLANQKMSFTA